METLPSRGAHTPASIASDLLKRGKSLVTPALQNAVDRLSGPSRTVSGYHLGWWDEHGNPETADGGKALRPALVFAAAEAVGGRAPDAVPAAVAVELLHNASLLHDDVIDGDQTRRHRRTAWTVFGTEPAILTGDALEALAFDALADTTDPAQAVRGLRMLHTAWQELIDGQHADTAAEERTDVDLTEALRIAEAKTAALLGASCGLGALYGGGSATDIARLTAYGRRLGSAFQLVDDLLGIWGDPSVTGKPVHSDLTTRKKSAPIAAALAAPGDAARDLRALYAREHLNAEEIARCAELVELAGGRDWCRRAADRLLGEALAELTGLGRGPLESLARFVVERDR